MLTILTFAKYLQNLLRDSTLTVISILPLTKYLQNLFRDSTLTVISIAKKFLFYLVLIILKMANETFFDHLIYPADIAI